MTTLRDETPADADVVYTLTLRAFDQKGEADLIRALHAGNHVALSLVAEDNSVVVGHALLSKMETPSNTLGLGPVSTHPDHQRRGIASAIVKALIERAQKDGWSGIFVLGDPAFYGRFGFRIDVAASFETHYPKDHFMALELKPDALQNRKGAALYAAPFTALD